MAQIFEGEIRFGVHAGPQHTTYENYSQLWQTVESLGYNWCSVFDHFIPIMSDPLGPCFEGPTLLAALAAQTRRIRCGILVIGNTYRHPAVLAKIAATLDHVSGGRLEWGIGGGWWEMEHQEYGIAYPTIGRRLRMLGETAKIQKELWTQPRSTFEGRYYQLTDALCEPKPVQNPLPLWIGGMGEQLTLRVVAESADGWNTFWMPLDAYRRKLDVLAGHCRVVGRNPADIRKSLVVQVLVGDDADARARAEQLRARGQTPLTGAPEQIAAEMVRYAREAGVGDFILGARVPYDYANLERFINDVAPLVRKETGAAVGRPA
ncbi:MAG TPA: TIGR03560 family F420-dependent LLM class oxidoreductase [Dehalococcoidia bacterium]|nr:TIGR03560 family F420-dependent LLM class oxidoreductase [Dehalococcoidia bacterium]